VRGATLIDRPPRRRVRAVTVDCWGTIFLDGPASDDRYKPQRLAGIQAVLTGVGVTVGLGQLDRAYAEVGQWLGRLWQKNRDVSAREHVVTLLEVLVPGLPARLSSETIGTLIREYVSPALVVPPAVDQGARAALEALAANGVALAVISNTMRTPGEVLRKVLDQSGLLPLFRVLTFSDECRIRKPARGIFLRTLRGIDVPPEDAVHVGDDSILDVKGARDAGMRVIQVVPDRRAAAPVKPDAIIRHLGELPVALGRLQQSTPPNRLQRHHRGVRSLLTGRLRAG
jgi:putative hydrolase of the HAD superfamily